MFESKHCDISHLSLQDWVKEGKYWPDQYHYSYLAVHKMWHFPLRISSVNVSNPQETVDLVTFAEEILYEKRHFSYNHTKPLLQCRFFSEELKTFRPGIIPYSSANYSCAIVLISSSPSFPCGLYLKVCQN